MGSILGLPLNDRGNIYIMQYGTLEDDSSFIFLIVT